MIESEQTIFKNESVSAVFIDKKDIPVCLHRFSDGISNINYLVQFLQQDKRPVVMTVYPESEKWPKIEKEYFTRSLIQDIKDIPIQKILTSGIIKNENGNNCAYLIKEYLDGSTLDKVFTLSSMIGLQKNDWRSIILDLGLKIATLHESRLPVFGDIKNTQIVSPNGEVSDSFLSWKKYYKAILERRFCEINKQFSDKQIGEYKAKDIQTLLPSLYEVAAKNLESLDNVICPRFVHNDINFLNILACQKEGVWCISGVLDFEAALSGDPDVDVVAIESQLHLSRYRDLFTENIDYFRKSYQSKRNITQDYRQKRIPYHISRSLSYFEAIFQMNFKLIPSSSVNHFFMEKHFEILENLAKGKTLEDIGIYSLF